MKRKKLYLLILMISISFSYLAFSPVSAFAMAPEEYTQETAVAYAKSLNGQKIDVDNGQYDCVDIAKAYFREVGGTPIGSLLDTTGDANAYMYADSKSDSLIPSGWERRYYPDYTPQPGDVAVWGKDKGIAHGSGHVAVVVETQAIDSSCQIKYIDQDSSKQRAAAIRNDFLDAGDPTCYIVPTFNQIIRYTVLILDCSGEKQFTFPRTWANVLGGSYTADSAVDEVKKSASKFVDDLSQSNDRIKNMIAVVSYGGEAAVVECGFTEDIDNVKNIITGLDNKEGRSDITSGLDIAYSLMPEVYSGNTVKNLILCTTGLSDGEKSNYDGYYIEGDDSIPSDWEREDDGEKLYACANATIDSANIIKNAGINIYVLGIFSPIEDSLPWNGKTLANFFRRTAEDISSGDGFFYSVEDADDLDFAFGKLEERLIGTKKLRIYNDCNYFDMQSAGDDLGGADGLGGNYEEVLWGPALFETPSTQLYKSVFDSEESINRNLALLSASLCATSYDHKYLVQAYKDLGVDEDDIYLYGYPDSIYNHAGVLRNSSEFVADADLAFSIASRDININNEESDVIIITTKGTQSTWEMIKNATCIADDMDFYGYNVPNWICEFEEDVMTGLNDYILNHEVIGTRPLKILVTGHSLGGACANIVAARLNNECGIAGSYTEGLRIDDIYAYTFGATDSISKAESAFGSYSLPVTEGHENIFNIYNLMDTSGAGWGGAYGIKAAAVKGNTIYGKFGDIYSYSSDMRGIISSDESEFSTHEIIGYVYAVKRGWPVSENRGKRIRINVMCPVDIEIFDDEKLVCLVSDNSVAINDDLISAAKIGETKVVILPADFKYEIRLTGTDNGSMELLIEEFGTDDSMMSDFSNVCIECGKLMNCILDGATSVEDIKLNVCDMEGKPLSLIAHDGTEEAVVIEEPEESSPEKETKKTVETGTEKDAEETDEMENESEHPTTAAKKENIIVILFGMTCLMISIILMVVVHRRKNGESS